MQNLMCLVLQMGHRNLKKNMVLKLVLLLDLKALINQEIVILNLQRALINQKVRNLINLVIPRKMMMEAINLKNQYMKTQRVRNQSIKVLKVQNLQALKKRWKMMLMSKM